MLWVMLVASLVGFLSVPALMTNLRLQTWVTPTADMIILWQNVAWIIGIGLCLALILTVFLQREVRLKNYRIVIQLVSLSVIFILTIVTSVSYGMVRQLRYQHVLLTAPLTANATVAVKQVSDTLSDRIDYANETIPIGNGYSRHIWQIEQLDTADNATSLPMTVLVTANVTNNPDWQPVLANLAPDTQLQVKLALQPIYRPQSQQLPHNAQAIEIGFDENLWLQTKHVQAKAQLLEIDKQSIKTIQTGLTIEKLRWQLRQKLLSQLRHDTKESGSYGNVEKKVQGYAVLLGLLTGDKALMSHEIKQRYQITGISHLLAISGPHVLMLASIISLFIVLLVKKLLPSLLIILPSKLLMLWVSVAIAGFYALLVGFELPAQRTFWMILLVTLATQWLMANRPFRVLALVALLMMWLDTTAVLQAGFWLSFVAVALLLRFSQQQADWLSSQHRQTSMNQTPAAITTQLLKQLANQTWQLFKLQLWLFVFMMPIVIWFFGKVSFTSVFINLIAVPFIGLVIVPLDMLAGVLSLIPIVGNYLSGGLWSGLASILAIFHHFLAFCIASGWAKQGFFALTHNQLLLSVVIVLIILARGIVPKIFALPIVLTMVAMTATQAKNNQTTASLTVLDNTSMTISLLVKDKVAWLILADNRELTSKPLKNAFKKKTMPSAKPPDIDDYVVDEIRQLLAKQQVNKLTGIISQTPSLRSNALVQNLAKQIPINAYWLAGFDPLHPMTDADSQPFEFSSITPSPCQTGKTFQEAAIQLTAMTGWKLDLALSPQEKLATMGCFIQITRYANDTSQSFSAILTAGRSTIPMQMSNQLCQVKPANLLIHSYQTPLDKTWLTGLKPQQVHLITGTQEYQQLPESSEMALMDLAQANTQIVKSHDNGSVRYQLQP